MPTCAAWHSLQQSAEPPLAWGSSFLSCATGLAESVRGVGLTTQRGNIADGQHSG